ncbi:MAG: hypothetical protein J0H88_05425 [Sphingomonadales bacterium]|nr:hypothetical protein [Sphingomonadales bacterium]
MGLKIYLPTAIAMFLAATIGSDVVARMSIAGEAFGAALQEHLYYARVQFIGTILLLAPFAAVAFLSARADRQARSRSVALIFAVAMATLLYFYFRGYQGAQYALAEKKWTAAALSVGLLPLFIGPAVVLASLGASALAMRFDRRMPDQMSN